MIQLQVLNYLLQTKDSSLIVMNNLTEKFFSDYVGEYKFIKAHLDTYGNICDEATFLHAFPDFELFKVGETPAYLIKELFEDYNTRKLAEVFNKVRTHLINGDTDKAMKEYRKAQESLVSGVAMSCVDLTKDTSRYDDYVEKCNSFGKYFISTGFKELDNVIGGWDREEELATIVARTNFGKSWILLRCATAAAQQGLNVGLYSGEMSERKVGYRFDTLLGHINNGGIVHGNLAYQEEYKHYIQNLPNLVKGSLKVLTPKMINGFADVNALRVFIEKEKLDILFIDQLSLLEDQSNGRTPSEKASNISKDLKKLQDLKRIPIISVSQQNRTTSENGVDTTQIAMSDRIGQDSTTSIFIEKKDDIMKLTLVKSRDNANGKVLTYVVDLNVGNFTYVPAENDANGGVTEIDYEKRYEETSDGEDVF